MTRHKALVSIALAALLAACASNVPLGSEWPATVVSYDHMQPLTRLSISLWRKLGDDMPRGRGVWKLWVDEQGSVRNVSQVESSGHQNFDSAVQEGLWKLRFKPWQVDGVPKAVTVAMPVSMR